MKTTESIPKESSEQVNLTKNEAPPALTVKEKPSQKEEAPSQALAEKDFVIHVSNLTKKFGEFTAVKDVTFKVPRGAIFGFIGPSGCGKTTTVRLMSGLYIPTSGDVVVLGGKPVDFTPQTRAKIGYMPQLFALYPDLTIWENMNFAASLYGMSFGKKRKERFNELLDFVELSEHKKKLAKKISGGMKRRLSLAATLVHTPELIFMDEPTAGIDPVLRRKFWDHFKALHEEGRTLFVTTQYVGEAAYCDYVGVMVDGRLLMVEPPEELRRKAYGGEIVHLSLTESVLLEKHIQPLQELPFVQNHQVTRLFKDDKSIQLIVDDASTAILKLIEWSKANDSTIETIEQYLPPFDDVFVEIVKKERSRG